MKRVLSLIFLASFCAIQSMEERENKASSNQEPYAARNEIGRVPRRTDQAFSNLMSTDEGIRTFYVGRQNGHYADYRRIPRIMWASGALSRIRDLFNDIKPDLGDKKKGNPKRLDNFKTLLSSNREYNGFPFNDINEALPLFIHPGVVFQTEGETITATRNDKTVKWSSAGSVYFNHYGEQNRDNWDFFIRATPLQYAAMAADWEAMGWLLEQGASPSTYGGADIYETPLQLLINLVRWEQAEIGRQEKLSQNDIAQRQKKAEAFVTKEWNQLVAESTSFSNKAKKAVTALKSYVLPAELMVLFVLIYYLTTVMYSK